MKGKTTHWLIRDQTSTLSYRRKKQDYKGISVVSNIIILLLCNNENRYLIIPSTLLFDDFLTKKTPYIS